MASQLMLHQRAQKDWLATFGTFWLMSLWFLGENPPKGIYIYTHTFNLRQNLYTHTNQRRGPNDPAGAYKRHVPLGRVVPLGGALGLACCWLATSVPPPPPPRSDFMQSSGALSQLLHLRSWQRSGCGPGQGKARQGTRTIRSSSSSHVILRLALAGREGSPPRAGACCNTCCCCCYPQTCVCHHRRRPGRLSKFTPRLGRLSPGALCVWLAGPGAQGPGALPGGECVCARWSINGAD